MDDWGKQLSGMIYRTEQRVNSYQKMVQSEYISLKKSGLDPSAPENREWIIFFKEFEGDEMLFLRYLRKQKTTWNNGGVNENE